MRLAASLVVLALLAAPASADRAVRTLSEDRSATGIEQVEIRYPVGRLLVQPSDDGRVHLSVVLRCKRAGHRCDELAQEAAITTHAAAGVLKLALETESEWDRWRMHAEGVLRLPADRELRVKMAVGRLDIQGLRGDVDVDLGVGEARLRMRESDVRSAEIASGVGDTGLTVGRRHLEGSGWLGHHVRWSDGPGRARVSVNLGVGETELTLE